MYELIGYIASVLVAVSLMMSSILRLRVINLIGAAFFTVYGFLIASVPVAAVNLFIVGINIFYLSRIFGTREYFRILQVGADSVYLRHFIELNVADIERYQPEFRPRYQPGDLIFFILRDVVPAGLVIGEPRADGTLVVHLDYVLPGYRDFRVGQFVYVRHAAFLRQHGVRRIEAHATTRMHVRYLRRMGFTRTPHGDGSTYVRELDGAATAPTP
jgi:hypothetical protein